VFPGLLDQVKGPIDQVDADSAWGSRSSLHADVLTDIAAQ